MSAPDTTRPDLQAGGAFEFLDVKRNFVLGGIENFPYQSQHLQLEPGDVLSSTRMVRMKP